MDKNYENSFIQGRELAKKVMIGIVLCSVFSVISLSMASFVVQMGLVALTTVLIFVLIYVLVKYCRCPYCGKLIILGVLAVTDCPRCRRNLTTGKKSKKRR